MNYNDLTQEQKEIWDVAYEHGFDRGWDEYGESVDVEDYREGYQDGVNAERERVQSVLQMMFEASLNMGQGNKAVQYRNVMDLLRPVEIIPDNGDDF